MTGNGNKPYFLDTQSSSAYFLDTQSSSGVLSGHPILLYWGFFPSGVDGFGLLPVWGYADVVDSRGEGIEQGQRYFGYFPAATHLVVRSGKTGSRPGPTNSFRARSRVSSSRPIGSRGGNLSGGQKSSIDASAKRSRRSSATS